MTVDKSELFEMIVESATDFAIFTTDPEGMTTSWNVGAERLFGQSEAEMVGSSADVIFTPEDRAEGLPERERGRARTVGRALDERWHQRKDGSRLWASGLMMPLRDPGQGFVKIARDLTESHRAIEQIRESEERFRLLATSIPQMVFRTRPDGDRTWGSPQWIEFTGLSLEDSVGYGWLDVLHPEDLEATRAAWGAARETGEYYIEHRVRRQSDGRYFWHQTRARPIDPAHPETGDWVGTMTDIDDLRGLQGRQQVLVAEVQHRTRNLIAVIQSIASQTLRRSASLDAFGQEFGTRLHALSRVQSLLAQTEHQHSITLDKLVAAELAAHGDGALDEGKVVFAGPPVALPATSAQAVALALHELATNAVKYGALAQPGGRLDVRWTLETGEEGPRVALAWRESGVTVPEDAQSRRRGYGRELIERALPYQLGARTRLEFAPDGVRCDLMVPVRAAATEGGDG